MDIHEELRANVANAGLLPSSDPDFVQAIPRGDGRYSDGPTGGPGNATSGLDNIVSAISTFSNQVEGAVESFKGVSRSVGHAYHEAKGLVAASTSDLGVPLQPPLSSHPGHMGTPGGHLVPYRPRYLAYGEMDPSHSLPPYPPSSFGGSAPGTAAAADLPPYAPLASSSITSQAEQIRHMWRVPPRVLVVDDDQVCRVLSIKMLSQLGCQLDYAVDGKDAVRKALSKPRYDLIFMVCFTLIFPAHDHPCFFLAVLSNVPWWLTESSGVSLYRIFSCRIRTASRPRPRFVVTTP
jgi:CheY-like chemotaxis protein